jgi:ubiquinone biosynthesis protein Coq4
MFDHDASHIISGYSTDLAGEVLNILFIQGHTQNTPRSRRFMTAPGLIAISSKTTVGFKNWVRYLTEAYDRGAQSASHLPHSCLPYEELLPKPLSEAREYLGVEPLPEGWDTSAWCTKNPYAGMDLYVVRLFRNADGLC